MSMFIRKKDSVPRTSISSAITAIEIGRRSARRTSHIMIEIPLPISDRREEKPHKLVRHAFTLPIKLPRRIALNDRSRVVQPEQTGNWRDPERPPLASQLSGGASLRNRCRIPIQCE